MLGMPPKVYLLSYVFISLVFHCQATVVFYTAPNAELGLSSGFGLVTNNSISSLTDDIITNFAVANIKVIDDNYLIAYGQIGYLGHSNTRIGSLLLYNISSKQWSIFGKNNIPALSALEINGVVKTSPYTFVVMGTISVLGDNPNVNLNNVASCNILLGKCSSMGGGIPDFNDILLDIVYGNGVVYVYYVNTYSEYVVTAWNGVEWETLMQTAFDTSISISNMAITFVNGLLYVLPPANIDQYACENETISVAVWNGTCWTSMENSERMLMIGATESETIYGVNRDQVLMKYENGTWTNLTTLPSYVEASQSFWVVSDEFIMFKCFLPDQLHTSIGIINLSTNNFTLLSEVICENGYGPSFTTYNGTFWYICRHYQDINIMQYDPVTQLHSHISTYGPVFGPVSKVSGFCPFGDKLLVWAVMSRISYAGDLPCNQSMAVWSSNGWIPPPVLEGFNPQWTFGYGVACAAHKSDLVLVFNKEDTIRLSIIDHDSLSVTYFDPPPDTIEFGYTPDIYVVDSRVYIVSNDVFMFDIDQNNWTRIISNLSINAVAAIDDILYIGGTFQINDTGKNYSNIAKFNTTSGMWMPIESLGGTVNDIQFGTVRGSSAIVYAVGTFSTSTYSAVVGFDNDGTITDYALDGIPSSQCANIIYDAEISTFYLLCDATGVAIFNLYMHSYNGYTWQSILKQATVYTFAVYNFTETSNNPDTGVSSNFSKLWIILIVFGALLVIFSLCLVLFRRRLFSYMRLLQYRVNRNSLVDVELRDSMEEINLAELAINEQQSIGGGSFGRVFLGTYRDKTVAVKTLIMHVDSPDHPDMKDFEREAKILIRVRHPNITLCIGYSTNIQKPLLVMEYMPKGSLYKFISSCEEIDMPRILHILRGIVCGMEFLHTMTPEKVFHRDLKSSNILLDTGFNAKICDFGMSKTVANSIKTNTERITGTVGWAAPEYLNPSRIKERTGKGDVFSFGVIVWELVTCQSPWVSLTPMDIAISVIQGERLDIPDTCDPVLSGIMQDCWQDDPNVRPEFWELSNRLKNVIAENKE